MYSGCACCHCCRRVLFCKIKVRPKSYQSYLQWRPCVCVNDHSPSTYTTLQLQCQKSPKKLSQNQEAHEVHQVLLLILNELRGPNIYSLEDRYQSQIQSSAYPARARQPKELQPCQGAVSLKTTLLLVRLCKSSIYSLAKNKIIHRGCMLSIYSLSTFVSLLALLENYVYQDSIRYLLMSLVLA